MAKSVVIYECSNCGSQFSKWPSFADHPTLNFWNGLATAWQAGSET